MVDVQADIVPFFIVGCSRSGTTLLQTLLDGHPNLAIPPESHIYERFGPVFHTYGDFNAATASVSFVRCCAMRISNSGSWLPLRRMWKED